MSTPASWPSRLFIAEYLCSLCPAYCYLISVHSWPPNNTGRDNYCLYISTPGHYPAIIHTRQGNILTIKKLRTLNSIRKWESCPHITCAIKNSTYMIHTRNPWPDLGISQPLVWLEYMAAGVSYGIIMDWLRLEVLTNSSSCDSCDWECLTKL